MTARLTLICHGATRAVRDAAFPDDEPLDPAGLAKAAALAGTLRRVDAAWCSPALRARQTAETLGLAATVNPALRDLGLGRWAGRSLAEIEADDPAGLAQWTGDPAAAPHGGETVLELIERVRSWLVGAAPEPGHTVAVTHAAVMRAAIAAVLDAPPAAFWRIDVMPLGRAGFSGRGGVWTLRTLTLATAAP